MVSCCSSYTAPAYIWAILSILSAIMCPFGLYYSNWLEYTANDTTITSLSSFRRCENQNSRFSVSCDDYLSFNQIYSTPWKAVTLLFGIGACLLILVALTAIFGFFIRHLFNIGVIIITIIAQVVGVLLYIAGILVFPVGWDADQVVLLCGSDVYSIGNCMLGWAFILITAGTAVALVAAFMSWTPVLKRKKDRQQSYSI